MNTRVTVIAIVSITLYLVLMGIIIATADHTPIAAQANRLCQDHKGVAQDGIESDYVICLDGYVAER